MELDEPTQSVDNKDWAVHSRSWTTNIFVILLCVSVWVSTARGQLLSSKVESIGVAGPDASGTVCPVSEKFGKAELQKLYDLLNSAEFQERLTKYNCGDSVPKLTFTVRLEPQGPRNSRNTYIYHSPGFSPAGRTRCLLFGVGYLIDKAVAGLDPEPRQEDTREPHCDCSKRDGKDEWVTHPGPSEILAPAKVAAKAAAKAAAEAEEVTEADMGIVTLDWKSLQLEPQPGRESLVTHEVSLGKLPPEINRNMLTIDPTFRRLAYVLKRGGKELVVLDGVEGKPYDEIPTRQTMVFSMDGKRFAYIARRGDKMLVVADGNEGKEYHSIDTLYAARFSPNGKQLAYIANSQTIPYLPSKSFMVLNGKEEKSYQLVEGTSFSPDSARLAYLAEPVWTRGGFYVVNGKEGKMHAQLHGGAFSQDGSRFGYIANIRTNQRPGALTMKFTVIDGKEGKQFKSIQSIRFSPDSKHLVYLASRTMSPLDSIGGRLGVLVRDDAEYNYGAIELGQFSPDSQHLAYVARMLTNWVVMMDGKKLNCEPLAGPQEQQFSWVSDLTFSPDSQHLAYSQRAYTGSWVVVDGHPVKSYEKIQFSPIFTPDSKRLAYVVAKANKFVPVLGGHEGKEYDEFLSWIPKVRDGRNREGIGFDTKGVLRAMAIRGEEVFRLEIELKSK